GAALAAADRHAGQRVLEGLLEAQELDDPEIDRGVEAQAALVGAEGGVELDPEAPVDLYLTAVVDPGNAEDDLPFGLAEAFDQRVVGIGGMARDHGTQALQHLAHGLV